MKAIYIAQLPADLRIAKDSKPSDVRMDGGGVYPSQFVAALIEHSTADMIFFPHTPMHSTEDFRLTHALSANDPRVRFVSIRDLSSLPGTVDLLLLSTGWRLEHLLTYRSALQRRPCATSALTHSLCSPSLMNTLLLLRLAPAREYDALVCSSRAGKQALEAMFATVSERCAALGMKLRDLPLTLPIIPLGTDLGKWKERTSTDEGVCNLLYFGRLSAKSKADLRPVLVAFARLIHEGLRANLVLAGDDTQSKLGPSLKTLAVELGCKDSITVISNPTSAEKKRLFELADIFISPSDTLQEQFGISLLEAMGAGLPVLASNWSGYRDIVVHGETGFLIDTLFPAISDEPAEMVEPMVSDLFAEATSVDPTQLMSYLRLLISDLPLRKRLGRAARERVRSLYNWKRVIGMHDDLWDELMARAANAPTSPDEAGLHLERWAPQRVFGGFAARSWRYDTRVVSAEIPPAVKDVICGSLASEFEANSLLLRLLNHLQAKSESTVMELGRESGEPIHRVVHSLGILAKHGLIIAAS